MNRLPVNLLDKEDGLDETSSKSRVTRLMVHILRQALCDGFTIAEAKALWEECAAVETARFTAEAWDRYRPEIVA